MYDLAHNSRVLQVPPTRNTLYILTIAAWAGIARFTSWPGLRRLRTTADMLPRCGSTKTYSSSSWSYSLAVDARDQAAFLSLQ